jgi:ElaB/YqjD/DUF883 family membrane-anchored ribosome-binding protein
MKTKTKQFQHELQQEKVRLERELHKVALTLEALAILTGERVTKAAKPLKKKIYKQSAKARKAMSEAKTAWWAARKKAAKA